MILRLNKLFLKDPLKDVHLVMKARLNFSWFTVKFHNRHHAIINSFVRNSIRQGGTVWFILHLGKWQEPTNKDWNYPSLFCSLTLKITSHSSNRLKMTLFSLSSLATIETCFKAMTMGCKALTQHVDLPYT